MRIVHLDHSGLPGGGQLGLRRLVGTEKLRHAHAVLVLTRGPVFDEIGTTGGDVRLLGLKTGDLRELIQNRKYIEGSVADLSPAIVVANSLRAAVSLALTRKHSVWAYYIRQDLSAPSMGRLRRLVFLLFVIHRFDALIANSHWTLSTAPKWLLRRRVVAIAPPLSGAQRFLKISRPRAAESGPLRIAWLGRVTPWKGLTVLLDALNILHEEGRELRVQVAGGTFHESARYAAAIEERAADAPFPIEVLGHVEDVPRFLAAQDVLVHTSLIPEPFGQVIIQGMAAGLPVVATNAGGPAEILTDGRDGLLVPPGDPFALANTLRTLADEPELRSRLGNAARATVRRSYDDAKLASVFEEALDGIMLAKGSR